MNVEESGKFISWSELWGYVNEVDHNPRFALGSQTISKYVTERSGFCWLSKQGTPESFIITAVLPN